MAGTDHDWIVIGSGFGGSVSALRLAEKGYDVKVLECGRRYEDDQFPRSTWDLRRYFYAPRLGLHGIFRLSIFKDITIVSGSGVGGGSLGYANTLYVPPAQFFENPQWPGPRDWQADLAPHYAEAERMLGVVTTPDDDPADQLLRQLGEELGVGDTYSKTPVGVFFGEAGRTVADPYFGGAGPERTGCTRCGRCMVGCPVGAKNTLRKNYLWLGERLGVKIDADRTVTDIRPLGDAGDAGDGSEGYAVTSERSGAWLLKRRRTQTARGVVVAAGALGTNKLLARCRLSGSLELSDRLGELVRTNSEAVLGVTIPAERAQDLQRRVAITSSIHPDDHTHIETVVYGNAGNSMSTLFTLMVGDGTRITRPLKLLAQILLHPGRFLKLLFPRDWSRRTVILLVMQTLDNAISLRARPTRGGGVRLQTEQDPEKPNPTFIPAANAAAKWFAERTGGIAGSSVMEALFNIPTTAHVLGGAVIGASPADGVVDARHRVFGYRNLMVCDGAAVPANPGVNPSLTITAMAELAISHVPPKGLDGLDAGAAGGAGRGARLVARATRRAAARA